MTSMAWPIEAGVFHHIGDQPPHSVLKLIIQRMIALGDHDGFVRIHPGQGIQSIVQHDLGQFRHRHHIPKQLIAR